MKRIRQPRRGLAMVLVVSAIALGTVLGLAMLAASSMQVQVTRNLSESARSDGLAESGLNLAIYYLQHPYYAPELVSGAWPGTGGPVALGGSADGTIDVEVARSAANPWVYTVTSTGQEGGSAMQRAAAAEVYLVSEYRTPYAAVFGADVTVPASSSITGNVYCGSNVTLKAPLALDGVVHAAGSTTGATYSPLPAQPMLMPANLAEIRSYSRYDANGDGVLETALTVTSDTTVAAGATLGPTSGNPSGVRCYTGNLTLNSNVLVDGTLVVKGIVTIAGTNVRIRPRQAGLPALLVEGNLFMSNASNTDLTVEGLCWVGGKVDAGLYNRPRLTVRGSLLVNGPSPLFYRTPGATVVLEQVPAAAYVPDLTEKGRTIMAVKVMRWDGGA